MLLLYIVALLVSAYALDFPCKDGQITTKPDNNPANLIGNWSYLYYWPPQSMKTTEYNLPQHTEEFLVCPHLQIEHIKTKLVKEILEDCGGKNYPFKAEDAKLKLTSTLSGYKDIIFMKKDSNWMMTDCNEAEPVEFRKVSDDIMVVIKPNDGHSAALLSRKIIQPKDVDCLGRNIDVGKGSFGVTMCI